MIVVNGRQVIKCEHCQGSTICKHATWTFSDDMKQGFFRCSMCGDGVVRKAGLLISALKRRIRSVACAWEGLKRSAQGNGRIFLTQLYKVVI